jgi:phospholipase A1/A2
MTNRWFRPRLAAGLAALLGIAPEIMAPATAQAASPTIADCAAIAIDRDRLACYDRASGHFAAPQSKSGSEPTRTTQAAPAATPMALPPAKPAPTNPSAILDPAPMSMIDSAWGFDPASERYSLSLYRPNYVQFARFTNQVNEHPFSPLFDASNVQDQNLDSTEARFQISFKARLWTTDDRRWGVWAAYTQQSQWQIYNDEISRPFRETNYMPELMLSYRPDVSFGGFHWRLFNFGYNHQSNGRADPISRSWDRLIAEFGIERGNFALLIRPWYRIQEDESQDDNPDIIDYYGYGDITAIYKWRGHSFSLMGRGNLSTEKGAAQFSWTSPPLLGPLRGYVQAFTGYGDSLIDYNWKQNAIGIGVTLNDLL